MDNRDPFVYKTTDYGKTWTSIALEHPEEPVSATRTSSARTRCARACSTPAPRTRSTCRSTTAGSWEPLQGKLPHAPVHWLAVQEHFNDLVVGTYGRGFWILDDVTPLEQLTTQSRTAPAHLFAPRPAYRFRSVSQPQPRAVRPRARREPAVRRVAQLLAERAGARRPQQATTRRRPGRTGRTPIEITILDAAGEKIRTLKGTNKRGSNRVVWDLRYEPPQEVRLAHDAAGQPARLGGEALPRQGQRGVFYYGIDAPRAGPSSRPARTR